MACLRESPVEGCSGDVSCDEEGCQLRRFTNFGGTTTYSPTSEADCVLQLRLRVGDVAKLGLRHDEQDPDNPIRKEVERKVGIIRNEHVFGPSVAEENLKAFKREFEHAGDILQQNRHRSVPPYDWFGPDPEPVVTYEEGCACGGCEARRFIANYTGGV